jgi:hypothetical protein
VRADEPAAKPEVARNDAAKLFERLKSLAGDWVAATPEKPEQAGVVMTRFRVSAGGSALIETEFPGTEMEMVSVYTVSGDKLLMTHYCVLGNQPQFELTAGAGGVVDCKLAGGTNIETGEAYLLRADGTDRDRPAEERVADVRAGPGRRTYEDEAGPEEVIRRRRRTMNVERVT